MGSLNVSRMFVSKISRRREKTESKKMPNQFLPSIYKITNLRKKKRKESKTIEKRHVESLYVYFRRVFACLHPPRTLCPFGYSAFRAKTSEMYAFIDSELNIIRS